MKKFFLFAVAVVLLIVLMATPFSLEDVKNLGLSTTDIKFSFYTTDGDLSFSYADVVTNGNANIVTADISYAGMVRSHIKHLDGESFYFFGNEEDYKIVKEYFVKNIVDTQTLPDGIISCYGYNPRLNYTATVGGKKVNVQVVFNNGKIVVGSPLILGSY